MAYLPTEERGYGHCLEDAYGKSLQYTTSADLMTLANHEGVTDNHKNSAVWAYLSKLPPDSKVVLFWH